MKRVKQNLLKLRLHSSFMKLKFEQMKLKHFIAFLSIRSIIFVVGFIFVIFNCFKVDAQAQMTKDLVFGTYSTNGSAGTITVNTNGSKSSTGGLTYSSGSYNAAHLHVDFGSNGSGNHIDISYPKKSYLTGSNGGQILVTLSPNAGSYQKTGWKALDMDIGGKLTIGNISVNPAGNYSGIIYIQCYINNQ